MSTASRGKTRSATVLATLFLLVLTGCLEKHVVWSPDGKRAAVIAKDGLHLCAPDGQLTPLLLPGVYEAAWFGDSQRLVVARQRSVADWSSIANAIGQERAGKIAVEAESLWRQLESGIKWSLLSEGSGKKKDQSAEKIFLRENHGDALRMKLTAGEWDELRSKRADINDLVIARIVGDHVEPGAPLQEGMEKIEDIRLSPRDEAVAFTTESAPNDDKDSRLLVCRIDNAGAATVAEHVAAYPDWVNDGRSLVYMQASGEGTKDDVRLATLVQREVMDDKGKIKISENAQELAGLFFQKTTRVRCLTDGRILFNAMEITLPVAGKDFPVDEHEKLYALDLARQATLVRIIPDSEQGKLPKALTFFEVSPDERQVLFGGIDGEVCVLTLATGEVQVWQEAGAYGLMAAPVWRNAQEITYARRNPLVDGKNPTRKSEVVLQKTAPGAGDHEKLLSQSWSNEVLESIYSGSEKR